MSVFDNPFKPKRKSISKSLRETIRAKQGCKCKKCDTSLKRGGHIHHRNGNTRDNSISNLELLCKSCHNKRTSDKKKKSLGSKW